MSELVGAERGERAPERLTHRNGYRTRRWQTRAGELELAIPKLRRGSYFPSFLEPRRRSEQVLVSVVQEAYVAGVSTLKVDQVVEWLGLRISKSEVSRICQGLDEQVEPSGAGRWKGSIPTCGSNWPKLRSTNPLERVNRRDRPPHRRRRHLPERRALIRLAANVVIEQNDEWLVGKRYLSNTRWKQFPEEETKKTETKRRSPN